MPEQYQEAVAEARRLVKRSEEDQWRLAQLTYEQVKAGKSRVRWAKDVGISDAWAGILYRTWAQWGSKALEVRPTFSEAYRPLLNPAREAEGGQEVGRARSTIRKLPPQQRAEVVAEALADPEVADRVLRDPEARRTVRQADDRYHVDHQQEGKERYELAEPRSVQIGAIARMAYDLSQVRIKAEDAAANIDILAANDWPDNSREQARVLVSRAAAAVELVRSKIEGHGLDAELAALLANGGDA